MQAQFVESIQAIPLANIVVAEQNAKRINKEKKICEDFANFYSKIIVSEILKAIQIFKENPSFYCVKLDINFFQIFISDGYFTRFYNVHYGGVVFCENNSNWFVQNLNPNFKNLFVDLQNKLLKRGYYLLDISNSLQSSECTILLCLGKPDFYAKQEVFWHAYNKVN